MATARQLAALQGDRFNREFGREVQRWRDLGYESAAEYQNDLASQIDDERAIAAPRAPGSTPGYEDVILPSGRLNIRALLGLAQGEQDRARTANEGRYTQLLGELNKGYAEGSAQADRLGASEAERITRGASIDKGRTEQDFAARGLSGTTAVAGHKLRIDESASRNIADVNERVAGLKSSLAVGRGQALAGAIQSREDQYPDIGSYLGLIGQASAADAETRQNRQTQGRYRRLIDSINAPQTISTRYSF